ncbi:hypothetical protein AAFX60_018975 [Aliivibrio fischeri]
MSKSISKEMWKKLEEEMSHMFVNVVFSYQGYEITVTRVREGESKTCLGIYIDDVMKGAWLLDKTEDKPSIMKEVCCTKQRHHYSPSRAKKLIKQFGKRRVLEIVPDIHDKYEYLMPYFSKASVLCRQYKKLEGIELVKADCMGDE